MNSLAFVAAFAFIVCTSASVILPTTKILEGPSSRTTLLGPDGSVIDSVSPGSKVITAEHPAVVTAADSIISAPVVSTYNAPLIARTALASPYISAYTAPYASAYSLPEIRAYSAPIVSAYSTPVVSAYSAPVVSTGVSQKDTLIAGPSGHIATSKTVAGPAVVHHTPSLYAAPVVSAYSTPVVSAYSAPVVSTGVAQKDTLITGPSGHIATSKTVASPAVVHHTPSLYAAHGLLYH